MSGRTLRVGIHRDDGALAFQKVAKTDDRALFVFNIMVERRLDVSMTERLAGGNQAEMLVDPRTVFFSQRVKRRP